VSHGIPKAIEELARAEGLLTPAEVCKQLGISKRSLGREVNRGRLTVKAIEGYRFFVPETVDALDETPDNEGQAFVLDFALEALSNANEHVNKLVKLAHEPAQQTIEALLKENQSLRERVERQENTVAEVHTMYGELMRNTIVAEIEAEKERKRIEMQGEAFDLFKTQLLPMMLENMGGKKFLESFSNEQIDAALGSGVLTDSQEKTLKKVRAERSKKERKGDNETQHKESDKGTIPDSGKRRPGGPGGGVSSGDKGGSQE
jgi:hypothetical protein